MISAHICWSIHRTVGVYSKEVSHQTGPTGEGQPVVDIFLNQRSLTHGYRGPPPCGLTWPRDQRCAHPRDQPADQWTLVYKLIP